MLKTNTVISCYTCTNFVTYSFFNYPLFVNTKVVCRPLVNVASLGIVNVMGMQKKKRNFSVEIHKLLVG